MTTIFRRTVQSAGALALFANMLTPSFAQTLDEVVVSASRAQARSFDTPAAIQSVDRNAIQNGGPQVNLSESLSRVPGLTILDRSNYAQDLQLSIRGFGARSAFGIRGIRLLIDGIPATTPDGQGQGSSVSLTSTDRMEVLRGPMALLYGNSSGGVIQAFTSAAPQDPTLGYQYYVGSYGMHRADYQWGDTVGDYGIVADYSTFTVDGYRDNSRTDRKQFNGKLDFNTNEQTQVKLVFNQFDMPLAQDPLGLTRAQLTDPAAAGSNAVTTLSRKIVLQNQLGGSATYTVNQDRSFTTRAYYGTRDNLQYQSTSAWIGLNRRYYGVGLQYNEKTHLGDTPVEWASGYEFDRSREYREGGATVNGQKSGSATRSEDNQAENSDFFVQGSAHVSDAVSLVGGLRYSTVRFISDDYLISTSNPDGSGNVSYRSTNPVLGLTYYANEHLNLYANYGQGFETPTLAEMAYTKTTTSAPRAVFNSLLNAASSRHYEIGSKWVPNRQSRLDFSVFQIDSTDEIIVVQNSGSSAYGNAPGTSRTGWELASSMLINPHVSASLSASAIDAQYSQAFKCAVTALCGSVSQVPAGSKIPGIPATSVFGELAWASAPVGVAKGKARAGARVALELVQSGRIYANDLNTASADGRTVFNLSASQRWVLSKSTATLYARLNNISDERYVGSVIVNQSSSQFYEPGLPQNWTVGLSLNAPL